MLRQISRLGAQGNLPLTSPPTHLPHHCPILPLIVGNLQCSTCDSYNTSQLQGPFDGLPPHAEAERAAREQEANQAAAASNAVNHETTQLQPAARPGGSVAMAADPMSEEEEDDNRDNNDASVPRAGNLLVTQFSESFSEPDEDEEAASVRLTILSLPPPCL